MSGEREELFAFVHPWWQYALVVAFLAFLAWCWWLLETD